MNKLDKKEKLFLVIIFLLMLIWAILQPFDYAPDEYMRYKIPLYIYNHGMLPIPNNIEVIVSTFNASYAYYPLLLPSIVSALFMKMVSFISTNNYLLLVGSRLTSVLSGTIFVYYIIKILKKLTGNNNIKWLGILFASLMPQFIFLSSYVNNDVVSLMASSMIVYAWINIFQKKLDYKNVTLLSIGIIICSLSYYNAYGWILGSILLYLYKLIKDENKIDILKKGIYLVILVLLFISYFFIRNYYLNNGDMLGIKSFQNACEIGCAEDFKPSVRMTPKNLNMNYIEMLFTSKWGNANWLFSTYTSFIGNFGYMTYKLPIVIYILYFIIIAIGIIGYILYLFKIKDKNKLFFNILLIICFIIPIILSLNYSYNTDYQPQGRYIYPIFVSLLIFITIGYEKIIKLLSKKIKNIKVVLFIIKIFIVISTIMSTIVFIKSL